MRERKVRTMWKTWFNKNIKKTSWEKKKKKDEEEDY